MSLLRLLTTGKSLVSITDAESRYRVTSQRLLPQFGARRNPFSSSGRAEPAHTGPRSLGDHGSNGASPQIRSTPALSGEREAVPLGRLPGRVPPVSSGRHSSEGVVWRRIFAFLDGWKERLVGLVAHRRGKAAKSAVHRFSKPPVQGELSLDRIRVLRNDLSDADLEIVRAKLPTAPAMPVANKIAGAEDAWGRVSSRISDTGKTQPDEDR
jgi:hypothetical protein